MHRVLFLLGAKSLFNKGAEEFYCTVDYEQSLGEALSSRQEQRQTKIASQSEKYCADVVGEEIKEEYRAAVVTELEG